MIHIASNSPTHYFRIQPQSNEVMTSQKTFFFFCIQRFEYYILVLFFFAFQRFEYYILVEHDEKPQVPNLVGIASWGPKVCPHEYLISPIENWSGFYQLWCSSLNDLQVWWNKHKSNLVSTLLNVQITLIIHSNVCVIHNSVLPKVTLGYQSSLCMICRLRV